MNDFGAIAQNRTEARESPLLWFPGVDDYFRYQVDGTGSITATAMYLYENGIDVSSTKLSGSLSTSGRVIKSKVISSLVGGSRYKVYLQFSDSGIDTMHEITLFVPKLGVNPSQYQLANNKWRIREAPILIYPGQSLVSTLTIQGVGEITSASMYLYKGINDDSANTLSGTVTATGRQIQLKTISGLSGGQTYLMYVYFTDNGRSTCRYAEIICPKLG